MKRVFTLIFSIIFFVSCEKSEESSELPGKWKLVSTLSDPGDGSGKWQNASQHSDIEFFTDGSVKTHNLSEFKRYKVVDSVNIEFTSPNDSKINYRYSLNGRSLELNPPCIEACGLRFIKAN